MSALKPCPFCGGKAEYEVTMCDVAIRCKNNECRATILADSRILNLVINRWNRRETPQGGEG